jgi:predicted Fe-Mo cluster-binding NifX family protein
LQVGLLRRCAPRNEKTLLALVFVRRPVCFAVDICDSEGCKKRKIRISKHFLKGGLGVKKIGLSVLFLAFLMINPVYAENKGNIAVAAEGKTSAAEVSGVAARSPYFLIFDGDGVLLEAVENPHKEDRRRASESVVQFLAQKGVTFIVAGDFGQRMIYTMKGRNIEYMEFQGTAEEAVKRVMEKRK